MLLSDPVATVAVSAAVSIPRLLPCFHPETRATLAFSCFSIIQRLVRESNYWGTYHSLGSVYVDILSSALRVLPALQEFGCGALSPPSLDSFLGAVVYEPAVQIRCVMPAVLCALARGSAKTDGSADMLENFFLAFLKDDQSEVTMRPVSSTFVHLPSLTTQVLLSCLSNLARFLQYHPSAKELLSELWFDSNHWSSVRLRVVRMHGRHALLKFLNVFSGPGRANRLSRPCQLHSVTDQRSNRKHRFHP